MTATLAAQAAKQPAMYTQMDLMQQGENGVNTYRIPALVQAKNGTLIAVADARHDSSRDLPAKISLVMRRSFDNGAHWEPLRTIVAADQGGVGDPSLLLDRDTGRIWCFFAYGPPGIGFMNSKAGAVTGPTTIQVHTVFSDDDGATWSSQIDLTPQLKDPTWQGIFVTSGTDIQLRSGRFLLALVARDRVGVIHSVDAYSDDHGKSWHVGRIIGDATDESHPIQLRNGDVMQNMRNGKTRAIAISKDGGATFGAVTHDAALIDPTCNAGITRYDNGKTHLILFTNDASTRRENLTIKASYDDGRTWPLQKNIYPGPAAYSTVIQLQNGSIGVLYEYGKTDSVERIGFAHFNLAWLTQPTDKH